MRALDAWSRLNLWPRLAIAVTLGFVALFASFSVLALRAIDESTDRILRERLVLTEMAARDIDRVLQRAFFELGKATEFASFDPGSPPFNDEYHLLAHAYGRVGTLSLGVYFLDARGRTVLAEPAGKLPRGTDLSTEPYVRQAIQERRRTLSAPFEDRSGRPAVALAMPILNTDRSLRAVLVGLLDLSSPEVREPLEQASTLGHTGHAELVDDGGLVLAATRAGGSLKPGEHLDFYLRMLGARAPGIEETPYTPWHPVPREERGEQHVMAFAPLSVAPWGVAVGGTSRETFAAVDRLRTTLLVAGALALVVLLLLTLLGARLLVRPVRKLTGAAREMAAGHLERPVAIGEGGEIGALGESLETMRAQLRDSLETVRRRGDELEAKVEAGTAELTARSRQLSAVAAVATAATEGSNFEGVLGRALAVALEQTGMEAGAVRLVDGECGRLVFTASGGDDQGFPCHGKDVALDECPCGVVATGGEPVYLDAAARRAFRPSCQAPKAQVLALLPLRTPAGTAGVLHLSRSSGATPNLEERQMLVAIANQIAVTTENAHLLERLNEAEAERDGPKSTGEAGASLAVGELRIDSLGRRVTLAGRELHLSPTEYRLLCSLAERAGAVVPHDELLEQVWGPTYRGEHELLRVALWRLRHKLSAEPADPDYIVTQPGAGYMLVAPE